MSKLKTRKWDFVEHLNTEEDMLLYLEACAEDGDPGLIVAALGDIARARNISQLSAATGISRQGIYKAFSEGGNPRFDTVVKAASALGLRVQFTPVDQHDAA